jgi:DnaJ family protein C protein 17
MSSQSEKSLLLEMDLYKLLEVEETSTLEQIKKAYRKRALELHPDKNLDNKKEAETKFIQLKNALEILADEAARKAYDNVRRQKKEKAKRDEQLDGKRRKLKEELEAREKKARDKFAEHTEVIKKTKEEEALQKEIDRLRKEGSKLVEEEMEYVSQQMRMEKKRSTDLKTPRATTTANVKVSEPPKKSARIKISWPKNCGEQLNEELLNYLFSKYGEIDILVMSKKTSAILEYKNYADGVDCLNDERNLTDKYSISLKWLGESQVEASQEKEPEVVEIKPPQTIEKHLADPGVVDFNLNNFEDFEQEILKKLKAAASNS